MDEEVGLPDRPGSLRGAHQFQVAWIDHAVSVSMGKDRFDGGDLDACPGVQTVRTERLGGGGLVGRGDAQERQDGVQQGAFAGAAEVRGPGEEPIHVRQVGRGGPGVQGGPGQEPVQRFGRVTVRGQIGGQTAAGGGLQAGSLQQGQQQCGFQDAAVALTVQCSVRPDQFSEMGAQTCGGWRQASRQGGSGPAGQARGRGSDSHRRPFPCIVVSLVRRSERFLHVRAAVLTATAARTSRDRG